MFLSLIINQYRLKAMGFLVENILYILVCLCVSTSRFHTEKHFTAFFLQNGNWADRVCGEKHGFICMKTSASDPPGDEMEQNIGCKTVRELYFF